MTVSSLVKSLSIATHTYRPTRLVSRRIRRQEMAAFQADVAFYRDLVGPGALVFDVGANIGDKSEALLTAGARVVAFEPNPRVIPELRARCGHASDWTLVEAGLGAGASIEVLYARAAHGQSGMSADWHGEVVREFTVPVVTLDAAIRRFGRPHYCKIDVEGWEIEVLNGLSQALPLVSIEFHLIDVDIPRTRQCLERLLTLSPDAVVNVTPDERAMWLFDAWMPLAQFAEGFPGTLDGRLPHRYGDLYIRTI